MKSKLILTELVSPYFCLNLIHAFFLFKTDGVDFLTDQNYNFFLSNCVRSMSIFMRVVNETCDVLGFMFYEKLKKIHLP